MHLKHEHQPEAKIMNAKASSALFFTAKQLFLLGNSRIRRHFIKLALRKILNIMEEDTEKRRDLEGLIRNINILQRQTPTRQRRREPTGEFQALCKEETYNLLCPLDRFPTAVFSSLDTRDTILSRGGWLSTYWGGGGGGGGGRWRQR